MCAKEIKKSKKKIEKLIDKPQDEKTGVVLMEVPAEEMVLEKTTVEAELEEKQVAEDKTEVKSEKSDGADAEQVKNSEKDVPKEQAEKRRKGVAWWWLVIALVLLAVVAGGALGVRSWIQSSSQETGEESGDGDDQGKNPDESEGLGEVSEGENSGDAEGSEGSESEKPAEEKPVEEKPAETESPKEEPMQPIAPRPEQPQGYEGSKGKKLIALTFDDGPSVYTTPRLLDTLKNRGVKATFFVLGTMAQRAPDLLRREVAEGHEVASHTPYHNQLTLLSAAQVRAEALEMDRIFTEILGTRPPFTRPPYGSFNAMVGEALGQPMILWSVDPQDWKDRNASVVCSRVVSATREGSIILVHDIHATTVDAVPCIVDTLRSYGYEFVTVSELAASRGVKMVNGRAYYSF